MLRVIWVALLGGLLLGACHKSRDETITPATSGGAAAAHPPPLTWQPLPLPASFRGTVACPDCRGIDTYLELRNDHSYLLEERFLGRAGAGDERAYTLGHFHQENDLLVLEARTTPARLFRILTPHQLQGLDYRRQPLPHTLLGSVEQQLLPTGSLILRGHYMFSDDQGFFRDCDTNHSWPVATAGDSDNLEAQYQTLTGASGKLAFGRVAAHLTHQPNRTGTGTEEVLVVDRVIRLNATENCPSATMAPTLQSPTLQ